MGTLTLLFQLSGAVASPGKFLHGGGTAEGAQEGEVSLRGEERPQADQRRHKPWDEDVILRQGTGTGFGRRFLPRCSVTHPEFGQKLGTSLQFEGLNLGSVTSCPPSPRVTK